MRWKLISGALLVSAGLVLGACETVPVSEVESEKLAGYEKQLVSVSGGSAAERTLIASLAPKLKSTAETCAAFDDRSSALVTQCLRVSAVAYYLLGQGGEAEASRSGVQAIAARSEALCAPPVQDTKTAENCDVTKAYTRLFDTRALASRVSMLAADESAQPADLAGAFASLEEAVARDWPAASTPTERALQTKIACDAFAADGSARSRLQSSADWPAIGNASDAALIQASAAMALPVCAAGDSDCDAAACESDAGGLACSRQRLTAVRLLCGAEG